MLILKISLIASGKSGNIKRNRLTLWYKKKEETHKTLRGADMLCFTQNPRMPRVYADKKIIVYPPKVFPFLSDKHIRGEFDDKEISNNLKYIQFIFAYSQEPRVNNPFYKKDYRIGQS
jgi:hypothetical protein